MVRWCQAHREAGIVRATTVRPATEAVADGVKLVGVKFAEEWGFVLLPKGWVVERSFARAS